MIGPSTATIDAKGAVTVTSEARGPRPERFTSSIVTNPTSLSDSLTRFAKSFGDVFAVLVGWRRVQCITFENVACGTAGALFTLEHGLGRSVRWGVVDWTGATDSPALVKSTTSTADKLILASYVAGTAALEVW